MKGEAPVPASLAAVGLGGDLAALADLAFAAATPAATLRVSAGGTLASGVAGLAWPADPMELDLSDPRQRQFGDYELLAKLGQGGMGMVYRARQHSLDREVAIKLLAAGAWAGADFVERFRGEAQSAARMQHPNIVTIHEIGQHEGLPYFSMRLVEGQSLAERLQAGPLPPREAARLLKLVTEAVDYAHRLGVLHLDLKPANVLIEAGGEPLVADFGLARRLDEGLAGSEEVSGTPSYMAPEQASGEALGTATDVYGLGATLYETLTGQPPHRAATARLTLERVLAEAPTPPRQIDPSIPKDLEAVCLRCLAREPAARYPSARALAEDLGRFLEAREVQARPLRWWQRGARLIQREPRLSALVLLLVGSLLLGLLTTAIQRQRADALAAEAMARLWETRTQSVEQALAEGDGFRGLPAMLDNLREMEAAGESELAAIEARRIGILLANAPQPLRLQRLPDRSSIASVAFAPDGEHYAVAYHGNGRREFRQYRTVDGELEWTALNPGRQLSPFQGIPHGYMRYSSDGRLLLAGLQQQPVFAAPQQHDTLAFRRSDGELLQAPGAEGRDVDVIYSADGQLALARYRANQANRFPERVRLFRTEGWQPLGPEVAHPAIHWIFSPDGQALLATADGLRLQRLSLPSLQPQWQIELPARSMLSAWMFAADGQSMALGGKDGQVRVLQLASGQLRSLPSAPTSTVRWLLYDESDRRLAAYADDGELNVWAMPEGLPAITPLQIDVGALRHRLQLQQDLLLAAAGDELRAWRLPPLAPFANHAKAAPARLRSDQPLWQDAFDLHGPDLLLLGERNGTLSLWRWPASPLLEARAAPLSAAVLHSDGRRLPLVDGPRLSLAGGDWIAEHPWPLRLAELSANGRWLVSLAGRTLRIFEPSSGRLHGAPLELPSAPMFVAVAQSSQHLLLATLERLDGVHVHRYWVVDLERAAWLPALPLVHGQSGSALLDPLGRFVAVSGTNGLQLLPIGDQPAACQPALGPPPEDPWLAPQPLAIDRHGHYLWLAGPSLNKTISLQLWSLRDCRLLRRFERPSIGSPLAGVATAEGLLVQGLAVNGLEHLGIDGSIRQTEGLASGEAMHPLALSHHGGLVAQAGRDGVQLFESARGERISGYLAAPIAGNDAIIRLAFADGDRQLLAQTIQGRWLRWPLDPPRSSDTELARQVALRLPGAAANLAAEQTLALESPASAPVQAATRVLMLKPAAADAIDPSMRPLDLRRLVNAPWDGSWPPVPSMGGDALSLGAGLHRLQGIDLRIDGGIQLSGGGAATTLHPSQPRSDWVSFEAEAVSRVHILLLQHVPMRPDEAPSIGARIWLRASDGREWPLEIYRNRHFNPLWQIEDVPSEATIGWIGSFPTHVRHGQDSRAPWAVAYLASLAVPAEAGPIEALSFGIGDGNMEAPLFYAATLELATGPRPALGTDRQ